MHFVQTQNYILVRHTQDTILASYLNDMSKYNNLNEVKKTRLTYDNITVQLSKKNSGLSDDWGIVLSLAI